MTTKGTIDLAESTGRDGAIDHIAKRMSPAARHSVGRPLYASSNGDRWYLVRDSVGVDVVHVPNQPSGGHIGRVTIAEFLISGDGPEQQELLRLIGTLVPE